MFGVEYRWGGRPWQVFEWYRSLRKCHEIVDILRCRADGISDHEYRIVERIH